MWPNMRSLVVSLAWGASFVHSAINLDGSQAVEPATEEEDASPISDINTYQPDQHDCPPSCVDYANTHSWIPYFSVDRLRRCNETMLLEFSVTQPLDDLDSTILIRSCTIGPRSSANKMTSTDPVENPKKDTNLIHGGSLNLAPACLVDGTPVKAKLELGTSGGSNVEADGDSIAGLLEGMQKFFNAEDNCDENFLFAYHRQTVASVYIGPGLGKPTAKSALQGLADHFWTSGSTSNHTVAELCGSGRQPERVFGISIDTTGNLAAVQKQALQWSKGGCAVKGEIESAGQLPTIQVFEIAGANITQNSTESSSTARRLKSRFLDAGKRNPVDARAVCRYIQVGSGDGCTSLAVRCGIRGADFLKYNPGSNICANLKAGDYVCCSAGDPYSPPKPDSPKPNPDGTCATHLIQNGDSCDSLADQYGVTVKQIENWNKNKTWAWTECRDMLIGYNMCLSSGTAPLPPPQEGAACGPLVPGTSPPKDKSTSLADLNPCPLKACCSNWGFCGVFPAHCDIHAPKGGGPGTKEKGFQNTCVSNCGNNIKENSGAPSSFQRIGYYEAFGLDRECLWLKAKNANTDGTYTHIHWAFASIDPKTWKPVINNTHGQWDDFKKLPVKRILSFGGWAYSTEPATYNIIRSAIIDNRNTFATNLAQFAKDEDIDGIDIDWEYPGAPDILVGGAPIGQERDGLNYLRFLTVLKEKLGSSRSVSIAAPASYWYLKAFPIDKISEVVDYIVYMTYDLHGQWDYGNADAFDMCSSGKCIRSHVNLTETKNALSMITKAGVPNNKIFVGESSYGRSFRMAKDGCWGPMCEFTGSRTQSNANPGRCTKTAGYVAYAEIMEILTGGNGVKTVYDDDSDTDVMLYKGDYISFMTPKTKDSRRAVWKGLNFAGTIDWAVDLQEFTSADFDAPPERPKSGEGCIGGKDDTVNTGNLCEFSCEFGFCPDSLCSCDVTGPLIDLPSENKHSNATAYDPLDVDLNRLCKFACKYGYCPDDTCTEPSSELSDEDDDEPVVIGEDPNYFNYTDARWQNAHKCYIYQDISNRDPNQCKAICQPQLDEAEEEGDRTSNYGCVALFPLDEEIPWQKAPGSSAYVAPGECSCNNWLVNEFAEFVLDAMPIIAQIGCYILMSSIKFVLDVGLEFIPGAGKALDAGLDMATTAAQMASYIYPEGENPEDAFAWWLSPCGGTDLVPDDIKNVFDILSSVPDGVSSFKKPDKIKKGSGKKGDDGNPKSPTGPRSNTGGSGKGSGSGSNKPPKKKCKIPANKETKRVGAAKNTLRMLSCDKNDQTVTQELIVTTLTFAQNAKPTHQVANCKRAHSQACFHYSSAIRNNKQWETLTCPPEAATTHYRFNAHATSTWKAEHKDTSWTDEQHRKFKGLCDMDEFPPAYFLNEKHPAFLYAGKDQRGQRVRFLPYNQNRPAGAMWRSVCFGSPLKEMSDSDLHDSIKSGSKGISTNPKPQLEQTQVGITIDVRPEFSLTYAHAANPPKDDGLYDNPCWPSGIAAGDPGFALLSLDEWYDANPKGPNGQRPKWKYNQPYVKGSNGD